MFFWNSLAFSIIQQMLAIWSLVPLSFLKSAWTYGSSRFTYCWSLALWILGHYFASVWDECNCAVVWAFFDIASLWDWNENWPFPVKASGGDGIPVELFQILKDNAVKVLHSICQQIWKTQQWPQDWICQFSFQSQRKAMPKNAQTTTQLHSSHTLVK